MINFHFLKHLLLLLYIYILWYKYYNIIIRWIKSDMHTKMIENLITLLLYVNSQFALCPWLRRTKKKKRRKEVPLCLEWRRLYRLQLVICVHVSLAQISADDFVKALNEIRVQVEDVPISWNETLAAEARKLAIPRISCCNLIEDMFTEGLLSFDCVWSCWVVVPARNLPKIILPS